MTILESSYSLKLKTDLDALLQVSDVDPLCLQELCHDVPEEQNPQVRGMRRVGQEGGASVKALSCFKATYSFLRAERLFSSLT